MRDAELTGERSRIDEPGKIRGGAASVDDRTRHTERCGRKRGSRHSQERARHRLERRELATLENFVPREVALGRHESEARVRPTDIAD